MAWIKLHRSAFVNIHPVFVNISQVCYVRTNAADDTRAVLGFKDRETLSNNMKSESEIRDFELRVLESVDEVMMLIDKPSLLISHMQS